MAALLRHDPDPPGTPARRGALRLLTAVLGEGRPLDGSLDNALAGVEHPADRALARSLASGVLRWRVDLDALIDGATPKPLPPDARARTALRIGLAGHLLLGTPPHAVIATTLALTEGGPRRLVHAVLSRLLRDRAALPPVPTLPDPFAKRWRAAWGAAAADAAAAAFGHEPPIDLTLRDAATTAEWAERLGGTSLAPGHVRLGARVAIPDLPGFADGAWWVQDFAASLPARLLGAGDGRTVLDLCAAPGGKTLQLAAAGWQVTALDKSARRIERLEANLARAGLSATIVTADALIWDPEERFDAILLDAPCTATGTCRRHPDVLHRIAAPQIAEMAGLQAALLARAVPWLAPGGRLIYAVCSLEPEEGEAQAAAVALTPDPVGADELPAGLLPAPDGTLRTDPAMLAEAGGMDGFFIARWSAQARAS